MPVEKTIEVPVEKVVEVAVKKYIDVLFEHEPDLLKNLTALAEQRRADDEKIIVEVKKVQLSLQNELPRLQDALKKFPKYETLQRRPQAFARRSIRRAKHFLLQRQARNLHRQASRRHEQGSSRKCRKFAMCSRKIITTLR